MHLDFRGPLRLSHTVEFSVHNLRCADVKPMHCLYSMQGAFPEYDVEEIGDGNLNDVRRIASKDGKNSVIMKHAPPYIKASFV